MVSVEIDIPTPFLELVCSFHTPFVFDDWISITMTHEDLGVLLQELISLVVPYHEDLWPMYLVWILLGYHVLDLALQEQIAAQAKDTTQSCGASHA